MANLDFLDSETNRVYKVSEAHKGGVELNSILIRYLKKAPKAFSLAYFEFCRQEFSEAGLKNLHTLMLLQTYPYQDEVLETLILIQSPLSAEFLYQHLPRSPLPKQIKILQALLGFGQKETRPELLQILESKEPAVKLLALQNIDLMDQFPSRNLLERQIIEPMPEVQDLAYALCIKFYGQEWLQQKLNLLPDLDLSFQTRIVRSCVQNSHLPFKKAVEAKLSLLLPEALQEFLPLLRTGISAEKLPLIRPLLQKTNLSSGIKSELLKILYKLEPQPEELHLLVQWAKEAENEMQALEILKQLTRYSLDLFLPLALDLLYQRFDLFSKGLMDYFITHQDHHHVRTQILGWLQSEYAEWNLYGLKMVRNLQPWLKEINLLAQSENAEVKSLAEHVLLRLNNESFEFRFSQALQKIQTGLYHEGIWILQELQKNHPRDLRIRLGLATAHYEGSNLTDCYNELRSILIDQPQNFEALKLLARVHIREGKPQKALPVMKSARLIHAQDGELKEIEFRLCLELKDHKNAYTVFFDLPKSRWNEELVNLAIQTCFELKKYTSLQALCVEAKQSEYHLTPQAMVCQIICLNELNQIQESQTLLNHYLSIAKDAESLKGLQALAQYFHSDQLQEVLLLRLDEQEPSLESKLGLAKFYLQKNPAKSLDILNSLEASVPTQRLKAQALASLEHYEEAAEILEEILLKDPTEDQVPFDLGLLYVNQGKMHKALKYFEYYRDHGFAPLKLHYYLALCYRAEKNLPACIKNILLAVEEKPFHKEAWLLLADALAHGIQDPKLEACLEAAEINLADNFQGLSFLGQYYKTKNTRKALQILEAALLLKPEDEKIRLAVATQHLVAKNWAKAFHHFEKISSTLDARHLMYFIQAAENCLNFKASFELCLRLFKDENHQSMIFVRLNQLIQKRESFTAIAQNYQIQDLDASEPVLRRFPLLYYKLGLWHYHKGHLLQARQFLQQILKFATGFARTHFFLGCVELALGSREKARQALESALSHKEVKPLQSHLLLSEIYFDSKENEKAKASFHYIYAKGSQKIMALEYLFQIHRQEHSLKAFTALIQSAENGILAVPTIRMLYAQALFEIKEYTQSAEQFQWIPKTSPYALAARFWVGVNRLHLGLADESVKIMEEISQATDLPQDFHYYYGLGRLKLKQWHLARQQLDIHIENYPGHVPCLNALILTNLALQDSNALYTCLMGICHQKEAKLELATIASGVRALYESKHLSRIEDCLNLIVDQILGLEEATELLQTFVLSLFGQKKLEDASILIRKILSVQPDFLRSFLARDLHQTLRLYLLDEGQKILVDDYFYPMEIGHLYLNLKSMDKALLFYQKTESLFVHKKPDSLTLASFYENLATVYQHQGNFQQARINLQNAVSLKPDSLELLERLSSLLGLMEERVMQSKVDRRMFFLNADQPMVSYRLAHHFQVEGDLQNALFHLKNYLKSYPQDQESLTRLADLSSRLSMKSLEIAAYEAILKTRPDLKTQREILLKLGNAYLGASQDIKAAEIFNLYLKDHEDNSGLKFQLAQIYKRQNHLPKAIVLLREALGKEPSNPSILYELASAFFDTTEWEQARKLLETLIQIKPYHAEGLYLLGQISARQGNNKKALSCIEKALLIRPEFPEARILMARLFKAEGMIPDALRHFEKLFSDHKDPEMLLEIAILNLRQNLKDKALPQLKRVLQEARAGTKTHKMAANLLRQAQIG